VPGFDGFGLKGVGSLRGFGPWKPEGRQASKI